MKFEIDDFLEEKISDSLPDGLSIQCLDDFTYNIVIEERASFPNGFILNLEIQWSREEGFFTVVSENDHAASN